MLLLHWQLTLWEWGRASPGSFPGSCQISSFSLPISGQVRVQLFHKCCQIFLQVTQDSEAGDAVGQMGSSFILVSFTLFWFLSTPSFPSQLPTWLTRRTLGSTLDAGQTVHIDCSLQSHECKGLFPFCFIHDGSAPLTEPGWTEHKHLYSYHLSLIITSILPSYLFGGRRRLDHLKVIMALCKKKKQKRNKKVTLCAQIFSMHFL